MAELLERTTFQTSRLIDFSSEKELAKQCGHPRSSWPLVVVKELLDNALDASEEQGVAPEVTIAFTDDAITVCDNGAGIPPATVDGILDFNVRASSREAYVAPWLKVYGVTVPRGGSVDGMAPVAAGQ